MARLSSRSEFDPRTGSLLSASTALFFLVGAAFLLGGGARSDVTSLLLLRPLAVLVLAIGLLAPTPTASPRFPPMWRFGGASEGLRLLHLLPFTPEIWSAFPGSQIITGVFADHG